MKKSIYFYLILFSLILSACVNRKNSNSNIKETEPKNELVHDDCMRQELIDCVKSYLSEVDSKFPEFVQVYYTIYFYKKEEKNYFTIWGFNELPFYIELKDPSHTFIYTLFNINDRNIILITRKDIEKSKLYSLCKEKTGKEKLNQIDMNEYDITYDGSWFPKTYEYHLVNDKYCISKSDSLYVEFLGNEFIDFENSLKDDKQ